LNHSAFTEILLCLVILTTELSKTQLLRKQNSVFETLFKSICGLSTTH